MEAWRFPLPMPELLTARLRLRRFEAGDLLAAFRWASDAEVARYAFWDAHESPVDTQAFLELCFRLYAEQGIGPWAVELRETGELIGNCSFGRIVREERRIELSYFFARPHWGRGLATEAVRAMIDFGFRTLGARTIEARCVPENAASERVMQKAGLRYRGRLSYTLRDGRDIEMKTYALTQAEWLGAW